MEKLEAENRSLTHRVEQSRRVNEELTIKNMELDKLIKSLQRSNKRIRSEKEKLKNRGGGRKSIITKEAIELTKGWRREGKSLSKIAELLTLQLGINYSKSTVKNMVDYHLGDVHCS